MLDAGLLSVTIEAADDYRGMTRTKAMPQGIRHKWNDDEFDNSKLKHWVERQLIELLAGTAAQRRAFPRSHWRQGHGIGKAPEGLMFEGEAVKTLAIQGSDIQTAGRLISDVFGDGKVAKHYYAYVEARADELVHRYWPQIQGVAEALLKHKTLSADAVRAVLRDMPWS